MFFNKQSILQQHELYLKKTKNNVLDEAESIVLFYDN